MCASLRETAWLLRQVRSLFARVLSLSTSSPSYRWRCWILFDLLGLGLLGRLFRRRRSSRRRWLDLASGVAGRHRLRNREIHFCGVVCGAGVGSPLAGVRLRQRRRLNIRIRIPERTTRCILRTQRDRQRQAADGDQGITNANEFHADSRQGMIVRGRPGIFPGWPLRQER